LSSLAKRLDYIEPIVLAGSGKLEKSVYGVVDRVDNIDGELVPNFIRRWKGTIGNMEPTDEEPTICLVEKLEPMILKHKKHKGMYGGRAGTKSRFAQDVMSGEINSCGSKVYVLRERMKSLKESIYAGINKSIKDLKLGGFLPVPSHWEIRHKSGGVFTFGGMQNIIDMKGSSNYKYFLMEEAARTKQVTIDTLGPTLRDTKGAELWWIWNNESSTDAMSQEFIVPYQAQLDRDGYYEDDHHLIIKVGYQDNPWFEHDESLFGELTKDKEKVADGRMSASRFNHIWEGAFNDDLETSIITAEWFDACVDAHIKLNFGMDSDGNIIGGKTSALDPSDVGKDADGYTERQGVIFTEVDEIEAPNGNRAFDIASRRAKDFGADSFGWDGDGIGAMLRDQASKNFDNTNVNLFMYKGSTEVHHPEALFKADNSNINMKEERKNKDVFANKKAQNMISFAERVYRTYEAVVLGKYHDPETLVSFNSATIKPAMLQKLRAEASKLPLKPSDKIRFYTKEEMRKGITMPDGHKVSIPSPNLFDSAVLSFDKAGIIHKKVITHRPRPNRPIRNR
jgi:phage terminase large subunit